MIPASSLARRSDAGHVMAQVAACQRAVGVATFALPRLVEMRAGTEDLTSLAWVLSRRSATQGQPVRLGWGWWLLDTPHRALVLEDPASPGQMQPFLDGLGSRHADVAVIDISEDHVGLVVAGRLARCLMTSAAACLPEPAVTVRDGDEYWLLVVRHEVAGEMREVLLHMGRSDGAVTVASGAAELYRAARRVHPSVVPPTPLHPIIDPNPTGAPNP